MRGKNCLRHLLNVNFINICHISVFCMFFRAEALRRYIQEQERREDMLAKMNARGGGAAVNVN